MKRLVARMKIAIGIHGVCHRNAIYKLCAELNLQ